MLTKASGGGGGGGGREVVFSIRLASDPANDATLRQFAQSVAKAQADALVNSARVVGRQSQGGTQVDAFTRGMRAAEAKERKQAAREEQAEREASIRQREKERQQEARAQAKADRDAAREKAKAEREAARTARAEEREASRQKREQQAQEAKEEKEAARAKAAAQREAARIQRAEEREAARAKKEQERQDAKDEAEAKKAKAAADKEAAKIVKEQEKEAAQAAQARAQSERQAEQAGKMANQALLRGQNELKEAFIMNLEGMTKLGKGFAYLGLIGEEDTKKVVEGLLKIEAGFNILKGGVEVWMSLNKAVRTYKETAESINAAKILGNMAITRLAAQGGAAANVAGAAGGVAGMAGNAGGAVGAAGGIQGLGGLGSASAGPGGIAVLGLALAALGYTAFESSRFAPAAQVGGFRDRAATGLAGKITGAAGFLPNNSYLSPYQDLAASNKETDRRQKSRNAEQEAILRREEVGRIRAEEAARREQVDAENARIRQEISGTLGARGLQRLAGRQSDRFGAASFELDMAGIDAETTGDRIALAQRQGLLNRGRRSQLEMSAGAGQRFAMQQQISVFEDLRSRRSSAASAEAGATTEAERVAAAQRVAAIESQIVDAYRERMTLQQEESAARIESARQSVASIQEEIRLRKTEGAAAEQAQTSGLAKFGALNQPQQQRILGLAGRLQQGGAAGLRADELQQLTQFGGTDIRKQVEDELKRRGQAAGGGALFGGEQKTVTASKDMVAKLEAELKVKRDLVLKLETDDENLARQISNQMMTEMDRRDAKLLDLIAKEVDKQKTAQAAGERGKRASTALAGASP